MKLKHLLVDTPGICFFGSLDIDIAGITYSSKEAQNNFLFAALKGEKTDGFDYIDEALTRGASAVLSERDPPPGFAKTWIQTGDAREAMALTAANLYGHPSQELKVIGITGTKGKTTVTYILESILVQAGFKPGVIGTISYRGPGFNRVAKRTTPESPDLQRMMREILDNGGTHCLIEVSSHSLELKRVTGIVFDIAIFTNLSGEHLDYHKSMENYFDAKKKLFMIGPNNRMAVINTDDSWGEKLKSQISGGIISFGLKESAAVHAKKFTLRKDGLDIQIKFPAGRMSVSSSLLGKPNVYNILAAVAPALFLNIPIPKIKDGIRSLKGVRGRFQKIQNDKGIEIFVDYAHSDDALKNLLETANELNSNKTIVVFGAGGDRDKSKRARMGKAAGRLADWTIITSDNPRSEDPQAIIDDIEAGIKTTGLKKYEIIPDRRKAITKALRIASAGDYVLIAGKGHEDYQIIKGKTFHFDDAEVIRELLAGEGRI